MKIWYKNLPYAADGSLLAYIRVGQLLFNERVEIVKEQGEEVLVQCPHWVTSGKLVGAKRLAFWGRKECFCSVEEYAGDSIPCMVRADDDHWLQDDSWLVLREPFFESVTHRTYSAGTRFVRKPEQDTKTDYAVKIANHDVEKSFTVFVPRSITYSYNPTHSSAERRDVFCSTVRAWANRYGKQVVPYAWGGSAFLKEVDERPFYTMKQEVNASQLTSVCSWKSCTGTVWLRPGSTSVESGGFDCSGLIMRAAQMAGIPYFYKTTTALYDFGIPVIAPEEIEKGDLIVCKGHVMVITNVENNQIAESAGYGNGYGRVREGLLRERIEGVSTLKELCKKIKQGKTLSFIDRNKKTGKKFAFKVVKLL